MGNFNKNSMSGINWDSFSKTLGTLAGDTTTAETSKIDSARENGFRILRTEWFLTLKGSTPDEGPIEFGLSADVSATEIDECLTSDPQRPSQPGEIEESMRAVWPMGVLVESTEGNGRIVQQGVTKIGWSIREGTSLRWWFRNHSVNALTTGSTVKGLAKHFGVWLCD